MCGIIRIFVGNFNLNETDDLFALEMFYRYEEQRLCRLLGVVVDREGEANADFTDVMNTYFGHPYVPIGLVKDWHRLRLLLRTWQVFSLQFSRVKSLTTMLLI